MAQQTESDRTVFLTSCNDADTATIVADKWASAGTQKAESFLLHISSFNKAEEETVVVPDISRWRSSSVYCFVDDVDPPDIAWEWLRRNQNYQTDYDYVVEEVNRGSTDVADPVGRWGLSFPG